MSHTFFTYHFIFGTYRRLCVICQDHERELYKFMYDFLTQRGIHVYRIGGMPDHVHLLCSIPAKYAVAEVIKLLKIESSKFMRVNRNFPKWSGWAEGYGGFSIDASMVETRKKYIMNQRKHHENYSFADEYKGILLEHGISVDESILEDT